MLQRIRVPAPILCALALLAVACAPAPSAAPAPAKEPPKAAAPVQEASKPAAAPAAKQPAKESPKPAAARANWPTRITIGGAEPGTALYGVATGWGKVLQEGLSIPTNVSSAGGSQSNVQAVQSGEVTFGGSSANNIYEGLTGTRWAEGKKTDKVRVILPAFVQYMNCFALKDAGVGRVKDFDRKPVVVGPAGTQFPVYAREIFQAVGASPSRVVAVPWNQAPDLIKDKQVAGACWIGGPPLGPVAQLATTHPLAMFGPADDEREQIIKALPFFFKNDMSKDFYKGVLDKDVPTLSVQFVFHGGKDLPEDFVYEVLKVTFPSVPEIAKAHRSGSEIQVKAAANVTVPFHKGAHRYYVEQGVRLPDAAKPID